MSNKDAGKNREEQDKPVERKSVGRRSLLKTIAATGGVVTAAAVLPGAWAKPVVGQGTLPAHAALSENDPGPGKVVQCDYDEGDGVFFPSCQIDPALPGVSMTLTILIGGSPVATTTVVTGATGFASTTVNPGVWCWNGMDTLTFQWSFTFLADGLSSCSATVEMNNRPS